MQEAAGRVDDPHHDGVTADDGTIFRLKIAGKDLGHSDFHRNRHHHELATFLFVTGRIDGPGIFQRLRVRSIRKDPVRGVSEAPDKFFIFVNGLSVTCWSQRIDGLLLIAVQAVEL